MQPVLATHKPCVFGLSPAPSIITPAATNSLLAYRLRADVG
jgi:hypothetical protein